MILKEGLVVDDDIGWRSVVRPLYCVQRLLNKYGGTGEGCWSQIKKLHYEVRSDDHAEMNCLAVEHI